MWKPGWRDEVWTGLQEPFDLIVIGGGITGAGILREASRAGIKTILLEAQDFAAGTSSRSAKLVHGGLRYLKNAQVQLTLESVRERERLLREGSGLVSPLGFTFVNCQGDRPPGWIFGLGLVLYDCLGLKWKHKSISREDLANRLPLVSCDRVLGAYHYLDAQADDARLVLRVLQEAITSGGKALNYARVESLLRGNSGVVCGVAVHDLDPAQRERTCEVTAPVVINATGGWADDLRAHIGGKPSLRKLRGSHLIFPWDKLPLSEAISFNHPIDRRPMYAFPWEGVTIVGTTDVDHTLDDEPVPNEPSISNGEIDYLFLAVQKVFQQSNLAEQDVVSTFSGIRAVVNTGKANPSKESREHISWDESGMLTITGGKLTTFRLMAHQALGKVRSRLRGYPKFDADLPVMDPLPAFQSLDYALPPHALLRLSGRYGADTPDMLASASPPEFRPIADLPALWVELRWAARSEAVQHLDDLLLRRVRIGLCLPDGGKECLPVIKSIVQGELGWDDSRWEVEENRYLQLVRQCYSIPQPENEKILNRLPV